MPHIVICQSCSMPMDKFELFGTQKDGTLNEEYCIHCFKDGKFTNPGETLEEMETKARRLMNELHVDPHLIETTIQSLRELKRWKSSRISVMSNL